MWLTLALLAHSHGCDEVGRECDKIFVITCNLASLASLASAPPIVAFARSITGRDELARFSYCECGLRSLTHMGVMRQGGNVTFL